jgi:cysteine desulfurase
MDKAVVYLDSAATTFLDPEVKKAMDEAWAAKLGNASSIHQAGVQAAIELERARAAIAGAIGAGADEVFFTSGGTESNNLAIQGHYLGVEPGPQGFACSAIEHSSVLAVGAFLAERGVRFRTIGVEPSGELRKRELEDCLRSGPSLLSVMHGNNEFGTIQDIAEVSRLCRKSKAYLHVDACQSFTKIPLDVSALGIDFLSICSHKIHGPKGIGALYVRRGLQLRPLFHGGGQELGLRPGTLNVEAAVGFARAVEIAGKTDWEAAKSLRSQCELEFEKMGFQIIAKDSNRLPNVLGFFKPGFPAKKTMLELGKRNIFVSTGSACHANRNTPSHALSAIGLGAEEIAGAMRISFAKWTTEVELGQFFRALAECLKAGG